MEDHRIFQRFESRYPVRFKDTRMGYGRDVILRNASAQGIKIKCKERQYINDHLTLEVALPDGRNPMVLKGRVVWVQKEEENNWDVGVEFHQVDMFGLSRMFRYVDFPSPNKSPAFK